MKATKYYRLTLKAIQSGREGDTRVVIFDRHPEESEIEFRVSEWDLVLYPRQATKDVRYSAVVEECYRIDKTPDKRYFKIEEDSRLEYPGLFGQSFAIVTSTHELKPGYLVCPHNCLAMQLVVLDSPVCDGKGYRNMVRYKNTDPDSYFPAEFLKKDVLFEILHDSFYTPEDPW